jgi:hypothetical protein
MTATLTVPAARGAPPKDLEVRPKQVKAWADALPLAQTVETARQIRDHLAGMNSSKVEADDRAQILQHYRPIVSVILEELEAIYAKSGIPLPTRARDALSMARDLAAQLATAYTIAANDKSSKLIAFGAKKHVSFLLLRATEYLSAVLRASYKAYTPVPEGVWRATHEIYLYADAQGFVAEPADPETKASILELYGEALLLALTDPYRLRPGELDRVVAQLRSVKAPVVIGQQKLTTKPAAHFLVPCDTDKPPKPALSASDDRGGKNWRLLDANPIVEKLRARKGAFDKGQVSAAFKQSMGTDVVVLLPKLITLWGDPPKRTSRRDAMDTSVAICIGLRAVTHYVGLEPRIDPQAETDRINQGITIPLISIAQDENSRSFPVNEWEVVNQSVGGLKVRRTAPALQQVSVGEIVGVKLIGRARWTIGMVRWITVLDEGGMEFGIQFISSAARQASIRPTISSTELDPKPALILNEALPWKGGESLLVSSNTFADLREFEIEDADRLFCVRATNLFEKTGRYEVFEFIPS